MSAFQSFLFEGQGRGERQPRNDANITTNTKNQRYDLRTHLSTTYYGNFIFSINISHFQTVILKITDFHYYRFPKLVKVKLQKQKWPDVLIF